jgi:uncharacterized protein YaaQ
MKLVIAIVQDEDAGRLVSAMMKEGYGVTKLATTGGFLRAGNTTLLTGVEDEKLDHCLEFIENICKSRKQVINSNIGAFDASISAAAHSNIEIMIGGATVFVLSVDQFKKY